MFIPKGLSAAVSPRRTCSQANGQGEKKTKGKTMIYRTLHRTVKIEGHELQMYSAEK